MADERPTMTEKLEEITKRMFASYALTREYRIADMNLRKKREEENLRLLDYYLRAQPVPFDRLDEIGYFDAPASANHHLAVRGGLAMHSVNVTRNLLYLSAQYGVEWPRVESPYIVGMFHDLCKCFMYHIGSDGKIEKTQSAYPGHGTASAYIAMVRLGIDLRESELMAIQYHMGAFNLEGKGLAELDAALDLYPKQIICTHTADMLAARVDEAADSLWKPRQGWGNQY